GGLRAIDHVAMGLPVDQLDTWILFYRAVLGMQPGDSLELSDPFGLIRSSGVSTANRRLRGVLNVLPRPYTQAARPESTRGRAHDIHAWRRERAPHRILMRRHLRDGCEVARGRCLLRTDLPQLLR